MPAGARICGDSTYTVEAATVVPASMKSCKSLQEHCALSVFMWDAAICRL